MDDPAPIIDPAVVWAQIESQHQARAALAHDVLATNKANLFDALQAAGTTRVEVRFDGSGDSGQIEEIIARTGEVPVDMPDGTVAISVPLGDGSGLKHLTLTIADAIERLAYDFLEETHGGWEINEGAFGDFTFDVEGRTIQLDYNERIETSEYSGHTW